MGDRFLFFASILLNMRRVQLSVSSQATQADLLDFEQSLVSASQAWSESHASCLPFRIPFRLDIIIIRQASIQK